MSQQENEDLLNQEQMKQITKQYKKTKKIQQKLRNWTIYCKYRGKKSIQQNYRQDIQQVGSFYTMRSFFNYYSIIKQPSILEQDVKIFYFLKGCKPLWEEWLDSGMLLITFKFKGEQQDKQGARLLNTTWQFLLFNLIGNNLPRPRNKKQQAKCEKQGQQLIVGLVLQRRFKISIIQVWYRNELHSTQLTRIIQQDILKHLKLKPQEIKQKIQLKYKRHKDSIQTNSTLKGGIKYRHKLQTNIGTVSMYL